MLKKKKKKKKRTKPRVRSKDITNRWEGGKWAVSEEVKCKKTSTREGKKRKPNNRKKKNHWGFGNNRTRKIVRNKGEERV